MTKIPANKPIILIICNYYLPGYKSGGGLRTLVNMVERFKARFDFRIITQDRDTDDKTYETVAVNSWNELDGAKVFYLSRDNIKIGKLLKLIKKVNPDSIYINSVFSKLTIFLLILKKIKILPRINIILAPEGELANGALQLKSGKKNAFIKAANAVKLYDDLIWKVAAEPEKAEIKKLKGRKRKIFIAPNLSPRDILPNYRQGLKPEKIKGEAKMIFLSRIMKTKNLGWLIDNLKGIEGNLFIDVFGPVEDEIYWDTIQNSIKKLPGNITVNYKGQLLYDKVPEKLFEYQFFILPTLGENFGHVFIEALAAGCPILISNRTPWTNLSEKGIGWDIPLENPQKWVEIINECIEADSAKYSALSSNSRKFARQWLSEPENENSTLAALVYSLEN